MRVSVGLPVQFMQARIYNTKGLAFIGKTLTGTDNMNIYRQIDTTTINNKRENKNATQTI
jgi:hypothetical protein